MADLALERFLASVAPHVLIQIKGTHKHLAAIRTRMMFGQVSIHVFR
jgi:hypothetical protein